MDLSFVTITFGQKPDLSNYTSSDPPSLTPPYLYVTEYDHTTKTQTHTFLGYNSRDIQFYKGYTYIGPNAKYYAPTQSYLQSLPLLTRNYFSRLVMQLPTYYFISNDPIVDPLNPNYGQDGTYDFPVYDPYPICRLHTYDNRPYSQADTYIQRLTQLPDTWQDYIPLPRATYAPLFPTKYYSMITIPQQYTLPRNNRTYNFHIHIILANSGRLIMQIHEQNIAQYDSQFSSWLKYGNATYPKMEKSLLAPKHSSKLFNVEMSTNYTFWRDNTFFYPPTFTDVSTFAPYDFRDISLLNFTDTTISLLLSNSRSVYYAHLIKNLNTMLLDQFYLVTTLQQPQNL